MSDTFRFTEHTDRKLNERMESGQGPQGLKTILLPKPDRAQKMAFLAVRFGSVDLSFRPIGASEDVDFPPGTAHFLEHELFQKEDENMIQVLASRGAEANAMTMYGMTGFYASTNDRLSPCLPPLFRTVFDPYFDPELVKREKQIIRQELLSYMDRPGYHLFRTGMEHLFQNHPLQYDVGGSVEGIDRITPDLLETCHATFYRPSNACLILAGNVDRVAVLNQCEQELTSRDVPGSRVEDRCYPDEPDAPSTSRLKTSFHTTRPRIFVGFKDLYEELNGTELVRREIEMVMALELLFGESSSFRMELYDDGLIDDSFDFQHYADATYEFTVLSGKTDAPDRLIQRISDGISRIAENGIETSRYRSLKNALKGQYIRNFDSVTSTVHWLIPHCFLNVTPFDFARQIEEVSRSDLMECIQSRLLESPSIDVIMVPEENQAQ